MNNQNGIIVKSKRPNGEGTLPELLCVSPSPHMRKLDTVRSIMLDVIIALMPVTVWGIYKFGVGAFYVILASVLTAVICEGAYQLICKKTLRVTDLSSVVTGLILGLSLPANVSVWVPCVGSAFAIIVVKQFFGGIGKNIVNPAIAARVFLMLCWPGELFVSGYSVIASSATPLVELKEGVTPDARVFDLLINNNLGAIGEVSAIAVGIGFLYLLFRRVISYHIPVAFVGTVALISLLSPITGESSATAYQILSGSLVFAAVFCATDYTTSPVTKGGKLIFGVGCGLCCVVIRYFGAYPEGSGFAILLMNLLVPLFEMWTKPKRFGGKK